MAHFYNYNEIISGKLPEDFGVSQIEGSSMTIPGQGSDLAQIIASIVKLPPLDERTFDSPSGVDPDIRSLAVKMELESLYGPEAQNAAEDAQNRQKARKEAKDKEQNENKPKEERSDNAGANE